MKICWDNLEKIEYRPDRGEWQDKKHKTNFYTYEDACKNCGEPFLSHKRSEGIYCYQGCLNQGRNIIKSSEMKKRISNALKRENHWNWQGGKSSKHYCSEWRYIRDEYKEDDGNTCQNPLCEGKSSKITSHHIDYNKKNCQPDNVITLCNSCNSRANFNRDLWQVYYTEIKKRKK